MSGKFRYPKINGKTVSEQTNQIKSFLHQHIDELEHAFPVFLTGENGTGKGTEEEIRKMKSMLTELCGEKAVREKEAWRELGLADGITELQNVCGRTPAAGCAFRVCEGGKHIYVAFNCTVAYSGEAAKINLSPIPEGIRPKKSALAICPCSEGSATVLADTDGNIYAEFTVPAESIVTWIDGYIDYWI
jgi:hypothetical protein